MATAIEVGVVSELELEISNPWDTNTDVTTDNPIGKIPALVLPDGDVLFDSPVICEYLDSLRNPQRLFPAEGPQRWRALTKMALADGLMDAVILRRREMMRPSDEQSQWWVERQYGIAERAINAMEEQAKTYIGIDIGLLTTAISLSYLDFRVPDLAWQDSHPRLSSWYEQFSQRPSIKDTKPHE